MKVIKQVLVDNNNVRAEKEYVRLDRSDLLEYTDTVGTTKIISYGQLEDSAHQLVKEAQAAKEELKIAKEAIRQLQARNAYLEKIAATSIDPAKMTVFNNKVKREVRARQKAERETEKVMQKLEMAQNYISSQASVIEKLAVNNKEFNTVKQSV